jgi:uncharacterized OB-fold protein
MAEYTKPLPRPSLESLPFWEGCKRHEFLLPRCNDCGNRWFPPSIVCPECLSTNWEFIPASGKGKVHGFGIYHRVYNKAFAEEVPYALALIELEEGPRIESNLINCLLDTIRIDMPVQVLFADVTDEVTLYKFEPAS